jgi:small subunit ribosomal protein S7
MSRRNISKKNFPTPDVVYGNLLVSLLIVRIIKKGKKKLAQKIVKSAFKIIEARTGNDSIKIFEKAVKNVTPIIEVKPFRVGGSTYQVPVEVLGFRGITLSLKWLIKAALNRSGKTFALKLANEFIDASNSIGGAIRKREETHKTAEANKAFSHFRY